jgi:hypothetical protein
MIGAEAAENVSVMKRVMREGHEIGNHTYMHPDISEIPPRRLDLEVNSPSASSPASSACSRSTSARPTTSTKSPKPATRPRQSCRFRKTATPSSAASSTPATGTSIPRRQPAEIVSSILAQLDTMKVKPQFRGSIILLHDGGGDRSVTVAALPVLIDTLRAHGYTIVQVSALMGKTTADVMPELTFPQFLRSIPDSLAFSSVAIVQKFIILVFFLGDILMSARLLLVGLFAIIDRLRRPHRPASPGYNPRVAVLIPAYNEETVIVRTIRSVLNSDYKNLHVIVIDDGSTDNTAEVARAAYAGEIAAGHVQVFSKPNGGKAAALNFALDRLTEEIYVGIDADTVIAADAISKLIPHFEDQRIGAMAGNAKVGNRVNLWTRWQALEYITSQNFERRALDLFHVVTVVPAPSAHGAPAPSRPPAATPQHRRGRRRPHHGPSRGGLARQLRGPLSCLH